MNIKRNIIFAPESRKKDGIPVTKNVPIRMRVIFASQRIEFTTGYRIDVEKWDTDKQRVRNGCTNKLKQSASEINAELLRQYTEIQNVFKEFEVQDVTPTPAQIKEAFNLKTKGEKKESHEEKQKVELDFMKVFNEFVAECSKQNDWSSSTLKKFATVKKHIYTFDPNTTFDSWTEKHFNDYIEFLRAEKNMRNTSIAYTIDEKNGTSSFLEKTFTLDKNGKVLDCNDYLSPSQKRKQTEERFHKALEQLGPLLIQSVKKGAAMAGKDTSGITNVTINGKTYSE